MNNDIFICIDPVFMKDKHYKVKYIPFLNKCSFYDKKSKMYIVDKKMFINGLKDIYKLSKKTVYDIYNTYEVCSILENRILFPVEQYFVKINLDAGLELSNYLDDLEYKVFLYLLNKFRYANKNHFYYNFSLAEILTESGYAKSTKNYPRGRAVLKKLEDMKIITLKQAYIYNKTMTLMHVWSGKTQLDFGEEKCSAI